MSTSNYNSELEVEIESCGNEKVFINEHKLKPYPEHKLKPYPRLYPYPWLLGILQQVVDELLPLYNAFAVLQGHHLVLHKLNDGQENAHVGIFVRLQTVQAFGNLFHNLAVHYPGQNL